MSQEAWTDVLGIEWRHTRRGQWKKLDLSAAPKNKPLWFKVEIVGGLLNGPLEFRGRISERGEIVNTRTAVGTVGRSGTLATQYL
jgi:hypothetical protein